MSPRSEEGGPAPTRKAPRRRFGTILGIPVPVVLIALLASGLMGVQLTSALERTTDNSSSSGATSADPRNGVGKISAGAPVVTETTLGIEVQRLIDSGTIQPMTSFDAATCLRELGVPDSILVLEEVAWGADETHGWLLVHGPLDSETLRANGGIVSVTVVLPTCGATDDGLTPEQNLLWSGDVMIGSL